MMDKRDQIINKKETVQEVIKELLDEMTFIQNIQQVRDEVQRRHNMDVSVPVVREQFKEMRISYKKVKQVSMQTNSDKSLVLRQRWAMSILELPWRHTNLIGIDETWLGMSEFRRMHWRPMDRNWSVKAKAIQPRISMITAVDRLGQIWISLTMSNSNESMMGLFME